MARFISMLFGCLACSGVHGLVLSSEELAAHWSRLDEFEGDGYERVLTSAKLQDGIEVAAYIYKFSNRGSSVAASSSLKQ